MLSKIFIQNFALIDRLEVDLHKGLQVITGETGAGKSIILGALRLMMGERADLKSIADAEKKSIVEGTFVLDEAKFKSFLKITILTLRKKHLYAEKLHQPVNRELLLMMFRLHYLYYKSFLKDL